MTEIKVRLIGGPQGGNVIDHDRGEAPGVTIVMSRIPEDGPMVNDTYRWSPDVAADGTYLAVFTGTRAIPEPDPELLKRGPDEPDEPDELDPELVPYLDWPVWMREDGVTCERTHCTHEDCQNLSWGPVQVSETGHTTVRAILAGIKAHAEETPS